MDNMDKLELMSAISNWEMLQAALDSGTDAVYFGVQKLNMRATAKNFTLKDLSKITKLCKKSKVKTYLTVNTLVYEDELKDLDSILKAAKGAKIDMIICWDLAVLKKAHELGLKICISTQASISNSKSAFKSVSSSSHNLIPYFCTVYGQPPQLLRLIY